MNVTCNFTVDNIAHGAYYNDRPLKVIGNMRHFGRMKTFWFVETSATSYGEIRIDGSDIYDLNVPSCHWAGLLLHCEARGVYSDDLITDSPWHNFTSNDLEWWSRIEGREICTSTKGMILHHSTVVKELVATGAQKIWAGNFTKLDLFSNASLIGRPVPALDGFEGEENENQETTCSMIPSLHNIVGFVTCFLDTILGN